MDVANSYSGGTVVNAGTLLVSNSGGLGSGGVAVNGGTLDVTAQGLASVNSLTIGSLGRAEYVGHQRLDDQRLCRLSPER